MQLTLKVVLNPRPSEVEFYNTILYSTHDILVKSTDDDDAQIEVDKEDLKEVEAATAFAEKNGIFDKAPPADKTPPEVSQPSIPQGTWDKLVADVAEVKANQEEIKKVGFGISI